MNEELTRVLNAGFEVTFAMTGNVTDDGAPVYACRLTAPAGDGTAAWGLSPAEALASVSPLTADTGPACECGHPEAEHTTASPDVEGLRGRRMCDRAACMCLAYCPAGDR